MEFNKIYIPEIVINNIYENILDEENIIFSHINNFTFNTFRNINKYKIFRFINNNYKLFKQYLNTYKYSQIELDTIGIVSAFNIKLIKSRALYTYYDLRYIFELILKDVKFDKKMIDNEPLFFIINTIESYKTFNRFETILNINNDMLLYPLHYNFVPDNNNTWMYI
jgi:hypothetical protein